MYMMYIYTYIQNIGNVNVYIDCMYIKLNRRIICLTGNRMESNLYRQNYFVCPGSKLHPSNLSLSQLPNVILSPLISGLSPRAFVRFSWATVKGYMNCASLQSALAATSEVAAMFETNTGCKIAVSTCLNHSLGGDFSTTTFPFGSLVQITVSILWLKAWGLHFKNSDINQSHPIPLISTPPRNHGTLGSFTGCLFPWFSSWGMGLRIDDQQICHSQALWGTQTFTHTYSLWSLGSSLGRMFALCPLSQWRISLIS